MKKSFGIRDSSAMPNPSRILSCSPTSRWDLPPYIVSPSTTIIDAADSEISVAIVVGTSST